MRVALHVLLIVILVPIGSLAQTYDLLLKGGHVIDPANEIDGVMDVAVTGNKIARVAGAIPPAQARKTVDLSGLFVVPGLIDLHGHTYGPGVSLFPDDTALVTGTTTLLDCGGPGWKNFEDYKEKIVDRAKTRVLTFINIVGGGMHDEDNVDDMDPQKTAAKILQYPKLIVGIKNAHFGGMGWVSVRRAVEAGRLSNTPVILDNHILTKYDRDTRTKLLDILRPGDMHTHFYNDRQVEVVDRFSKKVQPYMREARRRGVLFDMGHGAGSFLWPVASKAMEQGFPPDTISTDLHGQSIFTTESDMPNCISKLMNLGMGLEDAITRSTVNPAKAISRFPELGTLGDGKAADIAVLKYEEGIFALKDAWQKKLLGTKRIRCVLTVRDGEVVFDENGLAFPVWTEAGDYEKLP
jgi:dihydroorotase